MSMHEDFIQPLRRVSNITPAELEAYLREARRQRALAFTQLLQAFGRALSRPFRSAGAARSAVRRRAASRTAVKRSTAVAAETCE
jgi:hypothetical protein